MHRYYDLGTVLILSLLACLCGYCAGLLRRMRP